MFVLLSDFDLTSRCLDSDLDLEVQDSPLTLVAATVGSDYILVGADSQLTESDEGSRQTISKLQRHKSAPLAWGTSGNPALGIDRFTDWLESHSWPPKSLDKFQNEVAKKVAEINGQQRERWASAKVDATEDGLFSLLVAGWIKGKSFVFVVDNRGEFASLNSLDFHAIGSGRGHAKMINTTLNNLSPAPFSDPIERFWFTVSLTARHVLNCSLPIAIWKVKQDGIEVLGRE